MKLNQIRCIIAAYRFKTDHLRKKFKIMFFSVLLREASRRTVLFGLFGTKLCIEIAGYQENYPTPDQNISETQNLDVVSPESEINTNER